MWGRKLRPEVGAAATYSDSSATDPRQLESSLHAHRNFKPLFACTQVAESKQTKEASSQLNTEVLHISDILFKGLVDQHTREGSRHARQIGFGTCSDDEFIEFSSSYPSSCAVNIAAAASVFVDGDSEAIIEFTNTFCVKRCGQPVVDLFRQCGEPSISSILVYLCKLNEDGNTCGSVFSAVNESGINAVDACLPLNTTLPVNTTNCSSTCLQALDTLKDEAGCCANFDQINFGVQVADTNELYELCGEDTIEPCTEGILDSGTVPTFTRAVGGLTALVLTVTVLLL